MKKHRHRGILCNVGLWCPQVQIQITPFRWGLAYGISWTKVAFMLGPITVAIWFTFRHFGAECNRFNDPQV